MSRVEVVLLGNRMTDVIWKASKIVYDSDSLREIWLYNRILLRLPELKDLAIYNQCWDMDRQTLNAALEWAENRWPLDGNLEKLWFIWNDRANCRPPQPVARAADHVAELMLGRDESFEDLIDDFLRESGWDEGDAVDLDLSSGDRPKFEQVRPNFIWTMRGLAKAARLAEATGSDLVTIITTTCP